MVLPGSNLVLPAPNLVLPNLRLVLPPLNCVFVRTCFLSLAVAVATQAGGVQKTGKSSAIYSGQNMFDNFPIVDNLRLSIVDGTPPAIC